MPGGGEEVEVTGTKVVAGEGGPGITRDTGSEGGGWGRRHGGDGEGERDGYGEGVG